MRNFKNDFILQKKKIGKQESVAASRPTHCVQTRECLKIKLEIREVYKFCHESKM